MHDPSHTLQGDSVLHVVSTKPGYAYSKPCDDDAVAQPLATALGLMEEAHALLGLGPPPLTR